MFLEQMGIDKIGEDDDEPVGRERLI